MGDRSRMLGTSREVVVVLTVAQLRAVNTALAHFEAVGPHDLVDKPTREVVERTRQRVWSALEREQIEP